MRILISGASGLLGRALVEVLGARNELLTPRHNEMDTTRAEDVRRMVSRHAPDVLLHAAAFADPDVCHRDPDAAFRTNVIGARNAALACDECGMGLVLISSDYVFDGTKGEPYTEFDTVNPINVYGRTKVAAEAYIREFNSRHFIIRTGILFAPWGKNVLTTLLGRARRGEASEAVTDQTGAPTSVLDLARGIDRVINKAEFGTYHLVNRGVMTRYEWAQKVLALDGLDPGLVRPTTLDAQNRPAPRPHYTALRNYVLELTGADTMPTTEQALKECIGRLPRN